MARIWDSVSQNPDTTAISLARLVSRLEQKVLSPENEPTLVRSEYERAKANAVCTSCVGLYFKRLIDA